MQEGDFIYDYCFLIRTQLRNRSMEGMHREGSSAGLRSFLLFHLCLPGTKGTQKSSGVPCYLSSNVLQMFSSLATLSSLTEELRTKIKAHRRCLLTPPPVT